MSTRENWERLVAAVLRREELWQLFHQPSPSICSLVSSDDEDFQDSPIERRDAMKNWLDNSSNQGPNGSIEENIERKKYHPLSGILPRAIEGEQVAAGWPSWLAAVAGEAIQGWVPRRADSFEKLDKIGQGIFSNVYLARDCILGKIVALKKVRFDTLDPESVHVMAREILILRRLDHPNVIKLEGLVTSRMASSLYLVFEYMEHDLAGLASDRGFSFTEPQIKCYMNQLLQGLDHCHSRGVLHRDIKGSHLLIDNNGILKIAGFSCGTFYDPQKSHPLTSRVVTLWYRPPELLLGATNYGIAVDLWSTGCVLAELYAGKPIMPGRTEAEQLHRIFRLCGSPSDKYWRKSKLHLAKVFKAQLPYKRQVSETFKDFPGLALALIEILLSIDPADRGTAASALNSEFFTIMPHPCDPLSLPTYPPSKEFGPEVRERGIIVRRTTAQSPGQKYDLEKRGSRESLAVAASETNAELISSMQLSKGPNRLHSGPVLAPSGSVEQMLKEHERQINAFARRIRLDRGKTKTTVKVSKTLILFKTNIHSTRESWERLVVAVLRREELWQLFHQPSPSICSFVSSDDEDFQDSPIEIRDSRKNWLDNSSTQALNGSISATDDSQDTYFYGPERVKQYGKSVKELTALYKSQEIQAHNGSIWAIKFSLDGKYLASAGEDCVIQVWQVVEMERKGDFFIDKLEDGNFNLLVPETVFALSEKPICSFQGHLADVLDLSWSNSQKLLSSSMDKTVRLWDLSSKSCLKIFSHSDHVTCIQFNPVDDRYFISGSLDAKVRIWSIPDRQVVDWNDLHEMVTAACYTPDGQGALVGSYKGGCRCTTHQNKLQHMAQINLQNKKTKSHKKKITSFQFAPGSTSVVIVTSAGSRIRVIDGLDLVHKFKGFHNTNNHISASLTSNGKYVVSASVDSSVYVWRHEHESRPNRSKSVTVSQAYELFHCQDVSTAIPWPGISNNTCSLHDTSWPEEKLIPATKNRSPRVSVDFTNGFCQNKFAWGMVIVTAGLRGEIRTFQNFGLPFRSSTKGP